MNRAMVEFPILEAQALLAATADDEHPMTPQERSLAKQARDRLARAVRIEVGGSGSHLDAEAIANRFRNQLVRVRTTYGETITGTLVGLTGFRSLRLTTDYGFSSVNVSVVERVELAESPPVIGEIIEPPGSAGPVIIADGGERIACDGRMLAKDRYPLLYAQCRGTWGEDRYRFRVPALKPGWGGRGYLTPTQAAQNEMGC